MSLFVAIRLPDAVAADLAVAHSALAPELAAALPDLRWVPPQNWHLTLAFLGSVPEVRRADLETRLARAAARNRPLSLRLSGSGHFGSRVLYVGVAGEVLAMRPLAASVAAAARRAKVPVDERPYRPHLTLARLRGNTSLGELAAALASYDGPVWTADAIDLMESSPAGPGLPPSYVSRARFRLDGVPA